MLLGTAISFVLPSSLQSSSSVRISGSCCTTLTYSYEMQLKLWIMFPHPILSFPVTVLHIRGALPTWLAWHSWFSGFSGQVHPLILSLSLPCTSSWVSWCVTAPLSYGQLALTFPIQIHCSHFSSASLVCLFLVSMVFSDMALGHVNIYLHDSPLQGSPPRQQCPAAAQIFIDLF